MNHQAHITLPEGVPGIIGPMMAYPETAKILNELAEKILVQDSPTFSKAEREMVAGYVSYLNQCVFCSESHGAVADFHFDRPGLSRKVWENLESSSLPEKLKALLKIAASVQKTPARVDADTMENARKLGASDSDIHDTVLIAAAFCMFNRYVDGLNTLTPPRGHGAYQEMGRMLGERGYRNAIQS